MEIGYQSKLGRAVYIVAEQKNKTIGEILQEYRTGLGYTQTELAEETGVNQRTISAIETGKIKLPTYKTAVSLGEALGINPLLLLGEEVEKVKEKEAEPVAAEDQKPTSNLLNSLKSKYLGR